MIRALSFLQCFDTVGWQRGMLFGLQKYMCQLSPMIFFQNQWKKTANGTTDQPKFT